LKRVVRRGLEPLLETGRWHHPTWPARGIERFVVSFPKSGRTWLRVLMGAAEGANRGASLERESAEWLRHDAPTLAGKSLLFTHGLASSPGEPTEHLELFQRFIADRTRVFLVRDPRDTVVSYYFQQVKRRGGQYGDVPEKIADFARHPFYGVDRIIDMLNASQRAFDAGPGPALIVSYELLHAQPAESLARVFGFLGAPEISHDAIARAIEFSRFENMRKMEASGSQGAVLRPSDRNDEESFKTRKGKVGGFTDYFSADEAAWIDARIRERLVPAMAYSTPGAGPALRERAAEAAAAEPSR
ncbi:MAG: sulfotransferase domain-containing protein, partial [Myxococcota bacterium]